jgi:NADH-quinone oxidoreductase E subunit
MNIKVNNILAQYPDSGRDKLIPILQSIQESEGFISKESVIDIGKHLKLPASKIYGVATFYNQFRFEAKGKFHIQVCRGTACHVLGSATVLQELEKKLSIRAGHTTRDGLFSIEVVACIGACGLAPVICINGEFYAKVTTISINSIIEEYKNKCKSTE